ncbi:hypothetical protein LY474_36340 [Myxococcus stipitatus]|uniref:hypothetical protein n=1 Tax=Myxococcus stipitatus TaxID=83455 RepID=UPI001F2AAA1A|nr:hypothetical protein [Myxococcus stipitatus]MCE9673292.1 hypothetical protein [Myxococcus stipitatus]
MPDSDIQQALESITARYAEALGSGAFLRCSFFVNEKGHFSFQRQVFDESGKLVGGCQHSWLGPVERFDPRAPRMAAFLAAHMRLARQLVDLNLADSGLVDEAFVIDLLDDEPQLQTAEDFLRAIKDHIRFDIHTVPEPASRRARRTIHQERKGPQPDLFTLLECVTPDEMELEEVLEEVDDELSALPPEQRPHITPWLVATFDLLSNPRGGDTQVRHKGRRVYYKRAMAEALGRFYERWNGIPLIPLDEM